MPNLYRAENNREPEKKEKLKSKKKFDFNLYKKNTINSLNDVEYFLKNFNHLVKYLKLYSILKK